MHELLDLREHSSILTNGVTLLRSEIDSLIASVLLHLTALFALSALSTLFVLCVVCLCFSTLCTRLYNK